eukprot:m.331225 g.331225  ORF g.331225 m.331225 type:complete len:135 (+) comp16676_c0_seq1:82-486(+)
MQLFVQCQRSHVVSVPEGAAGSAIQEVIAREEGIPASQQYLVANGRTLDGEVSLAEQGVTDLSTVTVGVRLLGGKVHGSLARAGKVKGQTPKVEKQEKKKKKTGRAKRRIQYNKRFVNVVVGFGKKRGPNSNSE